jgi:tRNA-splicing ligase RtcB (3'-phosphate/5'-hydroxy nucleic acid ligase)
MKITNLLLSPVQPRSKEPSIATHLQSITLPEGAGRKVACLAHAQQPVIIPGSMGAPSYLLVGMGNKDWCASASHGAGRLRSRFDLSRQGNKESEEQLGLTGVDCITLRSERRIEEAPVAYKPITPVIDAQVQAGLVQVVAKMQPILTFKA